MIYRYLFLFMLTYCLPLSMLCQDVKKIDDYELLISEINELNSAEEYAKAISVANDAIKSNNFNCQNVLGLYRKIGVSFYLKDDFDSALNYWKDTIINGWETCEVSANQKIKVYSNISAVYEYLDEMDLFFEYFEKVLELNTSLAEIDTFTTVQNYIRAGTYFSSISDYIKAKTYFDQALLFFHSSYLDPATLELLYSRYGFAALENGQFQEGLSYFNLALENQLDINGNDQGSTLSIYINMSISHLRIGQLKEAGSYFRKARKLVDKNENVDQLVTILLLEAEILFTKGDTSDYLRSIFDQIILLTKSLEKPDELAIAYGNKAEFLLAISDLIGAEFTLNLGFKALLGENISSEVNGPTFSRQSILNPEPLLWLYSVSVLLKDAQYIDTKDSKYLVQSLEHTEKLDQLIKQARVEIGSEQSAINSLKKVYPALERGIEVALKLSTISGDKTYLEKAYSLATRNKAIVLREKLDNAKLMKKLLPKDKLDKLSSLQRELTKLKIEIQNQTNVEQSDSLSKLFFSKIEELDYYYSTLKVSNPKYFEITNDNELEIRISQIQNRLDDNQAVLEYFMGDQNLFSFLITKGDIDVMSTELDSLFYRHLDNEIRNVQSIDNQTKENKLYGKLIYPLLKILDAQNVSRLIIIPDGKLNALPFEALSDGSDHYLIQDFAISYNYSNTFLFKEFNREMPSIQYVGYGSKYSDSIAEHINSFYPYMNDFQLGNLTNSENEIIESARIMDGKYFLDRAASKAEFTKKGNSAKIIHLALHGISYGVNNANSGILFDDSQAGNFVLNTEEIYNLDLNTSLLILSVCQSAEGEIFRGEGIQSMSRAFFFAGSPAIVSSLWTASEKPTAEILSVFLKEVKAGEDKDVALQKAKLTYLRNAKPSLKNEKYWANLILIGSDEKLTFNNGKSKYYVILAILAGMIIIYFAKKQVNSSDKKAA